MTFIAVVDIGIHRPESTYQKHDANGNGEAGSPWSTLCPGTSSNMRLDESGGYAPTKSILEDSCMSRLSLRLDLRLRMTKAQCLEVGCHFEGFSKPLKTICKSHRNAQMRRVNYISNDLAVQI